VTIPLITALPSPAPSTEDPGNFDTRADALLGALPGMVTEENTSITAMNAAITQMNLDIASIAASALVASDAAGFVATSTSTLTVNAGTKTIHFAAAKPSLAVATYQVAIVLASDNSIKMIGNVATVVDSDDITVTVVTAGVSGSGTYSGPWLIIAGAFLGSGATAAEMWAGTSDAISISPKSQTDSDARTALTWASTTTPDMAAGWYRSLTASASFTLGAPTNAKPGKVIKIDITNSAGSIVLAVNAAWKRQGGLGIIGPNNGDKSKFVGFIEEVDGSGVMTAGTYNIIRTPT
jgi:hypothetical protein